VPDGETKNTESRGNLGFDPKIWLATDKLRNNMDEAEYEHVVAALQSSPR
jgi:hypothetical protein